jgi:GrpB-like predicted nucleotidyltransferase (UPF0157 family)
LEEAGYVLRVRERDFHEHRMFRTAEKSVHIHVFSPDSPETERYLLLRDRLRDNDEDRSSVAWSPAPQRSEAHRSDNRDNAESLVQSNCTSTI